MQPRRRFATEATENTTVFAFVLFVCFVAVVFVPFVATAAPHHSFAAEYDSNRPFTVTGTVTKLEWTNPHARLYLDAKDENGQIVHWDFELGPPTALMRRGWNRKSLQAGQVVTVDGFHSKTEPFVANAKKVTLPDGHEVFAGSSSTPGTPSQ